MKNIRNAKIYKMVAIICAVFLIIVGAVMCLTALARYNFDFKRFTTEKIVTVKKNISGVPNNLTISGADGKVTLTAEPQITVYFKGDERIICDSYIDNGTLVVKCIDNRRWFEKIGISLTPCELKIGLPAGEYGKLNISASSGNISIPDSFTFDNVVSETKSGVIESYASVNNKFSAKTQSGDIKIANVNSKDIELNTNSGSITALGLTAEESITAKTASGKILLSSATAKNTIISTASGNVEVSGSNIAEALEIISSSGNVVIAKSDASGITVETASGNVVGTLLTDKIYEIDTQSGKVNVPDSIGKSVCKVTTSSGNVDITVQH